MESFEINLEKKAGIDFLENLGFGFFRLDISGKLIYANPAFINLLEYDNFNELTLELEFNSALKLCLSPKRFFNFTKNENKFVWLTKNKRKKILKEFIQKVKAGNNVIYIDCLVQDNTEEIFLGKLIKDISSSDSSILKAIPDYILIINEHLEILESKNNIKNIFPNFQDVRGLSVKDILEEKTSSQLEELILNVLETGEQCNFNFEIENEFSKNYFEARIILRNHEEVIIILRDISREKQAEEQLKTFTEELKQSNATKDKFFSIIAHDLRTPLNGILNYAEILSNEYEVLSKEEIKEFADYILEISRSTNNLLNNLLEWARIQNGKINFEPKKNSLYFTAEKVLRMLSVIASNKQISILNQIDKEIETVFDSNMINSMLLNLINNAIKFSNPGSTIQLLSEECDNYYKISVKDEGIGISEENISKILNPNLTFTTLGTAKEKGTGLGLILCKEFAKRHQGNILIDSKPGEGTTFSFTISKYLYEGK